MVDVALLTHDASSWRVSKVQQELSELGLKVHHIGFPDGTPDCSGSDAVGDSLPLYVAIAEGPCQSLMLQLAYLLGRKRPLIICLGNEVKLPRLFRNVLSVRLDSSTADGRVTEYVERLLKIERPPQRAANDIDSIMTWIREKPQRLGCLNPEELVLLLTCLLHDIGMNVRSERQATGCDLVASDPAQSLSFLVDCKSYHDGASVGIAEVQRAAHAATALNCAFSLLVSASGFTQAALEHSKLCFPAVWLLDREKLEGTVVRYAGKATTSFEKRTRFFSQVMMHSDLHSDNILLPKSKPDHTCLIDFGCSTRPQVFLLSAAQDFTRRRAYEHLAFEVISVLEAANVIVWHDNLELSIGRSLGSIKEIAAVMQECQHLICFLTEAGEPNTRYQKIMKLLSSEVGSTRWSNRLLTVVGEDNLWNRLRLPGIFGRSQFFHPSDEHLLDILKREHSES